MARISISSTSTSSITVCVTDLDTEYNQGGRTVYFTVSSGGWSTTESISIPNYVYSSSNVTIGGLSSNTSYTVSATIYYSGGSSTLPSVPAYTDGSTDPDPDPDPTEIKPTPWGGFIGIASSAEYYGANGNDQYPITANEWNLFTDKINEFRLYSLGTGSEYSFTTVYKDTPFTAAIINQAIRGINEIGYNITEVSSGDEITARTFTTMKARINAIY